VKLNLRNKDKEVKTATQRKTQRRAKGESMSSVVYKNFQEEEMQNDIAVPQPTMYKSSMKQRRQRTSTLTATTRAAG
jgi:hypothetical protein